MQVALIQAHSRPEFLYLCLEHITKANNYNDIHYIVNLDKGFHPLNMEVIRRFKGKFRHLTVNKITNAPHSPLAKQSYAVLEGYRLCAARGKFVFMIEEDIMVGQHFFDWHLGIHALEPNIYASIGTRNNNHQVPPMWDLSKYYLRFGDYQSLGVCFKANMLQLVLAHANVAYYRDPIGYCRQHWPDSPLPTHHVEQDGLHRRVMTAANLPAAFSFDGLAFHAGYYGYNRATIGRATGTLEEKVARVRATAFDPAKLRAVIEGSRYPISYYYDSEPINLTPKWSGNLDKVPEHSSTQS